MKFNEGDIVLCQWGYDKKTNTPLVSLYEFGYDSPDGFVVYIMGNNKEQETVVFDIDKVRLATESEKEQYPWGK